MLGTHSKFRKGQNSYIYGISTVGVSLTKCPYVLVQTWYGFVQEVGNVSWQHILNKFSHQYLQ